MPRYAKRESPATLPAAVYVDLLEEDEAFAWLERDFQARSGIFTCITFSGLRHLRDDSRYADLLRRMGLRS